jgi:putative ABC transport system substrate-binding protein
MRRRGLIAGLLAASAVGPAAAQDRMPTVGVLVSGSPKPDVPLRIFREKLHELGYVEGRNIRLELRSAGGDPERLPELAAELVRQKVDVIVAWQTPVIAAAARATTAIPIVMLGAGDPVGSGFVASLAHPGGNITGVAGLTADLGAKHVELLKQMLPAARRIAALCNVPDPFSKLFLRRIEGAGPALRVEIVPVLVDAGTELEAAFAAMRAKPVNAVIVQPSLPLREVAALAIASRLPAVSPFAAFPGLGGLMAYTAQPEDYYSRPATFVDKILKGARPADLPVEQPTTYELTINLKTAKAIGLTVPQSLLARADEVIE